MSTFPKLARAYLVATFVSAALAAAWMVAGYHPPPTVEEVGLAAALGVLAGIAQVFVVKRAGSHVSDHLTPAPLFAAFLLLPNPLLLLVVTCAFVPEWVIYRRRWFIQLFNLAFWILALAAGKLLLGALTEHLRLERGAIPLPATAIMVVALLVLATQTLLLAFVLRLARSVPLSECGLFAPGKLAVEAALLCCGWAFATAWLVDPLYGVAAAVPLGLIFQALHVPNLREEAATDPKTGLANMRHFNAALARELERARRSGQPLSLLMCDLDFLRTINNTHGHQAGDTVLVGIADALRRTTRPGDVAGRFGGEEFVVLLPGTDKAAARVVAERLRQEVAQGRYETRPGQTGSAVTGATISIGLATAPEDGTSQEALTREADLAVYQAKRDGRDRVVAAGRESRLLAAERAHGHQLSPAPGARGSAAADRADVGIPPWRLLDDATCTSLTVAPSTPPADPAGPGRIAMAGHGGSPASRAPSQTTRRAGGRMLALITGLCAVACATVALGPSGLVPLVSAWSLAPPATLLALLGGLTVLAQYVAIDTGGRRGKISVTVVPMIAASYVYGSLGALVTALCLALSAGLRARSPVHRMVFNFSSTLLASQGAMWVFHALVGRPVAEAAFEVMVVPAVLAGLVYYAINNATLCAVRGLAEGEAPWRLWRTHYAWLWPYYAVFGLLALVVAAGATAFGWLGAVALASPVAIMQLAMRQYADGARARYEDLQHFHGRLSDSYDATLQALMRALDTRDEETQEHSQRVRRYAETLARSLGLDAEEVEHVGRGALLHDIGKIGVPDAVLLKPGALTDDERAAMRRHPAIGHAMIAHIPFLARASEVVLYHHESYDGTGYPSGLAGEAIPLGARIFALADTLDAMTSDRPYRTALSWSEAREEIARCRGVQFDPTIVNALLAIPESEFRALRAGPRPAQPPAVDFAPKATPAASRAMAGAA